jgi:predicted nucleic acid-binding protein
MKSDTLFVDVNVVLEILLDRPQKNHCIETLKQYQHYYISPTSIHIAFYFAEKNEHLLSNLESFLEVFHFTEFNEHVYHTALSIYQNRDMEDGLQVASAIEESIDTIFTLDQKMSKKYKNIITFI